MGPFTYAFCLKSVQQDGWFEGYASVFGLVDYQRDQVQKGAFTQSLQQRKTHADFPKMLWQHEHSKLIGQWESLEEDEYGLYVRGQLFLDLIKGREAYTLLKRGVLNGLSIGYHVIRSRKSYLRSTRILEEVDLIEISLVTFAANPQARVTSCKTAQLPQQKGVTMTNEPTELPTTPETRSDPAKQLQERLARIEAVLQRPSVSKEMKESASTEAFMDYVRSGVDGEFTATTKSLSSITDAGGGYLIPRPVIDKVQETLKAYNPVRALARVTEVSTDMLELILDKGQAEVGWIGETDARDETGTPELTKLQIRVHELYARPRATQKLLDDAAIDLEAWLVGKIADRMAETESQAFILGDGEGKPKGFLTYPTVKAGQGEWGKFEEIRTGEAGVVRNADTLIDTFYAMKSEYLPGSSWLLSRSALSAIRHLKDQQGHYIWQPGLQGGMGSTLLGHPVYVCDHMPGLSAGMASKSIVFGNFYEAYQIVERQGIHVLRDPYSAKPYVEFYTTKRVGGDVINFDALKVIHCAAEG